MSDVTQLVQKSIIGGHLFLKLIVENILNSAKNFHLLFRFSLPLLIVGLLVISLKMHYNDEIFGIGKRYPINGFVSSIIAVVFSSYFLTVGYLQLRTVLNIVLQVIFIVLGSVLMFFVSKQIFRFAHLYL